MSSGKDYYSLLGVSRSATTDELRRAFREAALRLHPDRNRDPGDTELFLQVNQAYDVLIDPKQRAAYDRELLKAEQEMAERSSFHAGSLQSRKKILRLEEPQVHYLLLKIRASPELPDVRPAINMSIVLDRSTSMRGQRLDQVRSATLKILDDLMKGDNASVIAFSDRAEVIVSPEQAKDPSTVRARLSLLQAGGGTEIAQGLELGLSELNRNFSREGVNHLILLTDGRTYGDEETCLELAAQAGKNGITIHGVGIGSDWSDRLLDDLAGGTGGSVTFLDSTSAVTGMLKSIFDGLGHTVAGRMRIEGSLAQQVDLRSSFRLEPDPMPLGDQLPISLGNLPKDDHIRVLLELVIHPLSRKDELTLAHLSINGDVLGKDVESVPLPLEITIPITEEPDPEPPPEEIVSALSYIGLYQMQEKARHEAELGQSSQAARRLENLATQLLATGERELARAALNEADRLAHSRRLSNQGEKVLKYGTRALLLPARTGGND